MSNKTNFFDPIKISTLQFITIAICFLMNMLDGMDVMVISYIAPALTKEWAITPQVLGVVFSAGLIGMTIGTVFLAPHADVVGRRNIILLCAAIMGTTVFATCFAHSIQEMMCYRFLSGLGIGGMLASCATLTSEFAPSKTKAFWISFVMGGYPIGAVLTGLAAAQIIPLHGWRVMLQVAGVMTLLTLPLVYFVLPESIDFLLKKRPNGALEKINAILARMKQAQLSELPLVSVEKVSKIAVASLFNGARKLPTIYLWISLFLSFATLYYLLTWIPTLAQNTGLSMQLAIYAGMVFNLGAFLGIVTQGYLSSRFGLQRTIFGFHLATAFLMLIFSFFNGSALILILFGLIGFAIQGGFVGLYAVAASLYPTEIRGTGVGWAMSMGRLGGIIGPTIGGALAGIGVSTGMSFIVFAFPALVAGIATLMISYKND
jgi:MFS transporter, AAHS family, 4-hydroxybenzoate transporter